MSLSLGAVGVGILKRLEISIDERISPSYLNSAPSDNDTALLKIILNRNIDIYVKRDGILDENLQKA